jgi:hypothetical protein
VIICKSCLGKALGAIDEAQPAPEQRINHTEAPALFFNHMVSQAPAEAETPVGSEAPVESETPAEAEAEAPAEAEAEAPAEAETPAEAEAEAPAEAETPVESEAEFKCPHCGQICKSELGLQRHIEAKHKDVV